jgi:multiple sugar transport system permease protein
VPVGLILPLLFAVLVNSRRLRGKQIFQTLFYLPTMVPLVAGAMIWRGVLNQQSGWVNRILEWLGAPAPGPAWLSDAHLAVPTLTLVGIWGVGGAMLVMLAGLQGIPTELYDAARVDGAGPLRSFVTITLPLLSPVLFYQLVLTTIGALQEFLRALVIYSESTGAGPDNAALFYMVNLYREAFVYFKMGYASALAWGLFLVALLITVALFAGARRFVYYASER